MKQNKFLFVIMVLVIIALSGICIHNLANLKVDSSSGIHVSGNGSGYEFSPQHGNQMIYIKTNDLVVTGNAQTDTYILLDKNVSSITIKDLKQNDRKIHIIPEDDMRIPEFVEISFSGENEICIIDYLDSVRVKCVEQNSELILSSGVYIHESLEMDGGIILAGYLEAFKNISIKGDIDLTLSETKHESLDDNLWAARIGTSNLFIDLEPDGSVLIEDCKEYYTVYVEKIDLGKNTELIYPDNGIIANYNYGDGPYSSDASIFDSDGNDVEKVMFGYVQK